MRRIGAATRAFAALGIATAVCSACVERPIFSNAPAPVPAPVDPRTQTAALEQRIFDLIQSERRRINPAARPLALDSELLGVARRRSEDMAQKNYFAHQGPQGQTSAALIMDEDQDFQGVLGENLAAQHFGKRTGVNVEAFAKGFVDIWLASPPHRDNLAFAAYDRSAVGAAVGGDTIYVTQLFASDLGLAPHRSLPEHGSGSSPQNPAFRRAPP